MNKLKTSILPIVGNISIITGALGIAAHYLSVTFRIPWLSILTIAHFQDFTGIFLRANTATGQKFNWITILFLFMMLIGGLIYNRTKGNDSRLIRFTFSIVFVKGLLGIVTLPFRYIQFQKVVDSGVRISGDLPSTFDFIWPLFYLIPVTFISLYIAGWLQAEKEVLVIENTRESGLIVEEIPTVSKWKRFWHLILDYLIMFFVTWPVIMLFANLIDVKFQSIRQLNSSSYFGLSLAVLSGLIIYYLLFEGFFKTTPAKMMTGTRVVNEETKQSPGFGKILGRTLSRRIPFEAFSFFGAKGWHDTIPGTLVVPENDYDQKMGYHRWWPILFLGIYVAMFANSKIQRILDQDRRDHFATESSIASHISKINHLASGDALTMKKAKAYWREPHSLLHVISADEKQITASRHMIEHSTRRDRNVICQADQNRTLAKDTVTVTKEALIQSIGRRGRNVFTLSDSSQYLLNDVYDFNHPFFKGGSSSWKRNNGNPTRTFAISHDLYPVELISIETTKGGVKWLDEFPMDSDFDVQSNTGIFRITAGRISETKPFKCDVVFRYGGEAHDYTLEGLDSSIKLYRKFE